MQGGIIIDRPNKRLRCMMMNDDTSLQRACPSPNNTSTDTSLALLASVASIAPNQIGGGGGGGGGKKPSVVVKDHDGSQHTIMSTICAGGTKQDLQGIMQKGQANTTQKNKIIRKVSLTTTEACQARIGAAVQVDTARATSATRSNKKIKLMKEAPRQKSIVATLAASSSSVSASAAAAARSAAAEKMAIKGVSLFLREMKNGRNPQDMVGSIDTMALCLRTEDALGRNDYARTLFAVNGYQIILSAMKQWNHHEALQRAGCNCLCIMTEPLLDSSSEGDAKNAPHQDHNKKKNNGKRASASATATVGSSSSASTTPRANVLTLLLIMEVIIQAMRTFPRSFPIQRNGIATLDNCCDQFFTATAATSSSVAASSLATTKANKRAQNRFVHLLLYHHHHQQQQQQQQPGHHPQQQEGQGQRDGRQGGSVGVGIVGGGGAVYLVTNAMKMFPQVLDLQVVGCSFIHTLVSSTSNGKNKTECWNALKQHHAMSTVTAAYENHPNNDDIKHHLQNIMDRMLLF